MQKQWLLVLNKLNFSSLHNAWLHGFSVQYIWKGYLDYLFQFISPPLYTSHAKLLVVYAEHSSLFWKRRNFLQVWLFCDRNVCLHFSAFHVVFHFCCFFIFSTTLINCTITEDVSYVCLHFQCLAHFQCSWHMVDIY